MSMHGWDTIEIEETGGVFLKLKADTNYSLAFLGTPQAVAKDWGDGNGIKVRIHSNVIDTSAPGDVKIFDMPLSVAAQVKSIFELSETAELLIKLKKTGAGLKTKYTVVAGPAIKADTLANLAKLELHELGAPSDSAAAPAADEDVPF